MKPLGVALIGCGGITLQNHLPGLALCPETRVVALCDSDPLVLKQARDHCGVEFCCQNYQEVLRRDDVHAVIVATPNCFHAPIVLEAVQSGKHVLCEKPLALTVDEARQMLRTAENAGVRHMTAFTYRFVPAMRYMAHLIKQGAAGRPLHFRSCRLQDWGERPLGWRQTSRMAGTGELGDMLSHRIDYAHLLVGRMHSLAADTRQVHPTRAGQVSDLEDWVAILARFELQATGLLESSKVATGHGEGARSQDYVEINGAEGSLLFQLEQPHQLQIGKKGQTSLKTTAVPREFLVWPGSPRNPDEGDPLIAFRYDQAFEFMDAIRNERPCQPSFADGLAAQAVMEAAILAADEQRWVTVDYKA
jgi:predicted dehydrogenase